MLTKTLVATSVLAVILGLSGCGGSNNGANSGGSTPPGGGTQQPIDNGPPELIDPPLTEDREIITAPDTPEKEEAAKRNLVYFTNTIVAETINSGLLDRLLWATEYMEGFVSEDHSCYKATNPIEQDGEVIGRIVKANSSCEITDYDAGAGFKVLSGSFTIQSEESISVISFENMKLEIGGKIFVFNGDYEIEEVDDSMEVHSTDKFTIYQEADKQTYVLENYELTYYEYSDNGDYQETSADGVLKVFDPEGKRVFHLGFGSTSPWVRLNGAKPYIGTLKITDLDYDGHEITVAASIKAEDSTVEVILNSKMGEYTPHSNVKTTWQNIVIDPSTYYSY